ncbi:MAG: DUF21 domain-containing protein, partial [Deltaproteobacteria bacterium]|nr:DUF21 domain-containing protein [Deltaproteobacteria bacterium]
PPSPPLCGGVMTFLLLLTASFSSFETALFSLSRVQRSRMEKAGGASSLIARSVKKPRELLMTVLLGNELANVAIAILAGSLAYGWFSGYGDRSVYLVSTALTTLILLTFGEIIPKNIAIRYPAFVAQLFIIPYQVFATLVFPLRWMLTCMDHLIGVLHVKELLAWRSQQPLASPSDLRPLLKDFVETNPNESLESLLKAFQKNRLHMAIVKNKGQVVGLITMDDLLRCFFEPL